MRTQKVQANLLQSRLIPCSVLCALAAAFPGVASVSAAEPAASAKTDAVATSKPADPWGLPAKPAWLTDLSLTVKEGYDDNIYASGIAPLQKHSSFFTGVSPKMSLNLAPVINGSPTVTDGLDTLSIGYTGDYTWYATGGNEDNQIHNVPTAIKGKYEAFSYNLENSFRYVDGNRMGIAYPDGNSAYATAILRERREQIQDRTKAVFRYDFEKFFIRPTASFLYYDLMTYQFGPVPADKKGYQNYVDRYDVNGGLDFGYKINNNLAATIGYRRGAQYQDKVLATDLDASNDYNRVLFGLEGKPFKWMKFEASLGPDFHDYTANSGFSDTDLTRLYADIGMVFDISSKDALSLKYKRWQWVSSTGKAAYEDSALEVNYKRKLLQKLGVEVGLRVGESFYHPPTMRDDWMYTMNGGLRYAFNSHLSADLDYSVDLGRNGLDDLAAEANREFARQIVSLALRVKY
jgi:hypothetical protein